MSNDTIFPPYTLTPKILELSSSIFHLLGKLEGIEQLKPDLKLRKLSMAKSICGSLAIEGNTLTVEQISNLLDGAEILGPERDVVEANNAIAVYRNLSSFKHFSEKSFLSAHQKLMTGLIKDAGIYRSVNVGIFQGSKVTHTAPQAKMVPRLMKNLFDFLKQEKQLQDLIKSAIFHYELEFIHPFSDGNGRMGRLWQTVMLCQVHKVFAYVPMESTIHENQKAYYKALASADKEGEATPFIEFSLEMILKSFESVAAKMKSKPLLVADRLIQAHEHFKKEKFSRKDYMKLFPQISTATASRDLACLVSENQLAKTGEKSKTRYQFRH